MLKRMIQAGACSLLLAACGAETALQFETASDADIITLFGDVSQVDRTGMDPVTEPVFASYGLDFQAAMGLSRDSLLALEQHEITVDFPAGGAIRTFSGPRLQDVLDLAQAGRGTVTLTALDGYQRMLDRDRIGRHGVILAISMDGTGLPLGGFGPAMLVWPRQDDPALAGQSDDDWIWSVFAIEIGEAD